MNDKSWFVAISAAGLLALTPPPSGAAPMAGAPAMAEVVHVAACGASAGQPEASYMGPFNKMLLQPALPPMAMIDFFNASNRPISAIEFGLVAGGKLLAVVRDVGSFAPNARIMHSYGIAATAVPPPNAMTACVPLRVRYADGTTWMNPSMPAH